MNSGPHSVGDSIRESAKSGNVFVGVNWIVVAGSSRVGVILAGSKRRALFKYGRRSDVSSVLEERGVVERDSMAVKICANRVALGIHDAGGNCSN